MAKHEHPYMATDLPEVPLTEPLVVPALYCTGVGIEFVPHAVQFVFWTHTPDLGGESQERRITARIALPEDAARAFAQTMARTMKDGRN